MKVVIGSKSGKTYQKEISKDKANSLVGKKIGSKFDGGLLGLEGYEFEITGGSDKQGFPMRKGVQGTGRRNRLLKGGTGIRESEKGIRRRKSIRGEMVSEEIEQLNCKVTKEGKKDLAELSKPAEVEEGGD